jgi:hypothetical protein
MIFNYSCLVLLRSLFNDVNNSRLPALIGCLILEMPIQVAVRSAAARLLGLRVRIPPGHGCLSLLSVVCCQVEVSASG